jgi:hypothetical protein
MTALAPLLFSAAQTVSAEPVGCLDGVTKDFDDKGVAVGDKVIVPVAPVRAIESFTPAAYAPGGTDATAGNVEVTIAASNKVSWFLTGEQIRSLENANSSKEWLRQMTLQGMRTLRNASDAACAVAIKQGACRALGTAGTTPFASGIESITDLWAEMKKNGAPFADMQLAMNVAAYQNILKQGIIQQAYAAGSDAERRSGLIKEQYGFTPRVDASITTHTPGGGTSYAIEADGGVAIGDYVLEAKTGSGTMLAGDVLAIQSDTNKYVCNVGLAAAGAFTIGRPGLRVQSAEDKTITIGATYTANVAYERSAVVGILRPPLIPENPTISQMTVSDDFGLTYLMLDIAQYGQRSMEIHLAYGFKVVQPEHVMILMG